MDRVVVGIDVGGTNIKACLATLDSLDGGQVVWVELKRHTPQDIKDRFVDVVEAVVRKLRQLAVKQGWDPAIEAIAVDVPGPVSGGVAVESVNLGWRELPVAAPVTARLGVPSVLVTDTWAGLVGERHVNPQVSSCDPFAYLSLGTGVGLAMLVDAAPWAGAERFGHQVVVPDGPVCRCGQRGCVEAVATPAAFRARYRQVTGQEVAGQEFAALVDRGDVVAAQIWTHGYTLLAEALARTMVVAGATTVVIGGGVVGAGDTLLDPITAVLRRRLGASARVVAARLGGRAGSLGAAAIAAAMVNDAG